MTLPGLFIEGPMELLWLLNVYGFEEAVILLYYNKAS